MATLQVELVAVERKIWSGEARMVIARTTEGELGILHGHAPLLEEDAQDLIFARAVSKLREHLESRSLGVDHVVVFVDELNKYAPGDGPDIGRGAAGRLPGADRRRARRFRAAAASARRAH